MSNKKREKVTSIKPKPTKSWEDMMAQAQLNALKPYIQAETQMATQAAFQKTLKLILENISTVQVRVWALERVLMKAGIVVSKEVLAEETAQIEDESINAESVEGPAAEGDIIRMEFSQRKADGSYPKAQAAIIHKLMNKVQDHVQTYSELEESIVGKAKGEEFEVVIPAKQEGEKEVTLKIKVNRISRKKVAPKAPEAEAPSEG